MASDMFAPFPDDVLDPLSGTCFDNLSSAIFDPSFDGLDLCQPFNGGSPLLNHNFTSDKSFDQPSFEQSFDQPSFEQSSHEAPILSGPTFVSEKSSKKRNFQSVDEVKTDTETGRYSLFPKIVSDVENCPKFKTFDRFVIDASETKCRDVMSGQTKFGRKIVIESFQPKYPEYTMPATLPAMLLMHTLCSSSIINSAIGFVSVFPVTVFKSAQDESYNRGGFPVLAVNTGHMKFLLWRFYSASRKIIGSGEVLLNHFRDIVCQFNPLENGSLITASGLDPYLTPARSIKNGFMLIPAHWFDVMRRQFMDGDDCIYDIGQIVRSKYDAIEELRGKFDDEFKPIWLGDQRPPNVMNVLKDFRSNHNISMARCRSLNGRVRIGKTGPLWSLQCSKSELCNYDENSFAFGVQCWRKQLQYLNSAYTFFTGNTVLQETHMDGFFELSPRFEIYSRERSIKMGIHNDAELKCETTKKVKKLRRELQARYGSQCLANHFGDNNVKIRKSRKIK